MNLNMSVTQGIIKNSIIFVVIIAVGLEMYSAFAQETSANTTVGTTELEERLTQFDHLLNIGVVAPLTALSLTGATFLTRTSGSVNEDPAYIKLIQGAKKNLIKAFVIFLACTIVLFIFDFIELLLIRSLVIVGIIDLVTTYSLLFAGFGYLSVAAKKMYRTQERRGFL